MFTHILDDRWRRFGSAGGRRLAVISQRRWRQLVLLLALVWLLAVAARLAWLLSPVPPPAAAAPVSGMAPVAATVAVDIEAMAGWQLFGKAGRAAERPAVVAAGIETRAHASSLSLRVQGLMSSVDGAQARALILTGAGQQQFAIGEVLPAAGRVTLAKVLADRAIIDNNGRYETLWLYDSSTAGPARAPAVEPDAPARAAAASQPQPVDSPASLAEVIQVSVVREGSRMSGYRVGPGRDAALFQRLGFQPDDLVTAVNGIDLSDPQRALELYNVLRSASEASFAVRRGSEELTLAVSLQQL